MSAPSTSGLSVELLLRVIDVKYGCCCFIKSTKGEERRKSMREEAMKFEKFKRKKPPEKPRKEKRKFQ